MITNPRELLCNYLDGIGSEPWGVLLIQSGNGNHGFYWDDSFFKLRKTIIETMLTELENENTIPELLAKIRNSINNMNEKAGNHKEWVNQLREILEQENIIDLGFVLSWLGSFSELLNAENEDAVSVINLFVCKDNYLRIHLGADYGAIPNGYMEEFIDFLSM